MIPKPHSQTFQEGVLDLTHGVHISVQSERERVSAEAIAELLRAEMLTLGFLLVEEGQGVPVTLRETQNLEGAEAYRMVGSADGIVLEAATAAGLFYATRALLTEAGATKHLGYTEIEDAPRYGWRGAHLDVARHFYSVDSIKRFIDLLALHKMNIFHWHLTEDQGWRIEIDAFPKLTEVSAFRQEPFGKYGGFYTKAEVREVVAYAKARFITVVPEIEMPGHAVAALAAYPELSCTGGPFSVETEWGVFDDVYCAGNDATVEFLEKVFEEVIELFPGEFFHIGGDECPKTRWKTCKKCQARIKAEGLADEDELQSWIVERMSRFLSARGKRLVGWDEILEGGLAPGAMVMSWRGTEGGVRAAKMKHDVIMSPTTHCYLDYRQSPEETEPGAWFAPSLDLETAYSYEPTPGELSLDEAAHVLGVQGNIWTEKMPTFAQVEYMTFPRLCALSEVAWSSGEKDFADFQERLLHHQKLLDLLGVGYRGSKNARPVLPTQEDRERYKKARLAREKSAQVAAY